MLFLMLLSIVIPAYNEERFIKEILTRVKAASLPKGVRKEVIVVNDASTDSTAEIVRKVAGVRLVSHARNAGKGSAIRTGLKEARGDIIIIQDADLEYNPEEIARVIQPIVDGKTKVSYGSRYLDPKQRKANKVFLKKVHKNAYQLFYIGGRGLTFAANLLYNTNITDEATCYKAFDAKLIKSIPLKCRRFEFCPEVTAKVAKRGYKIAEVPISYKPRSFEDGKKIKMHDGLAAIWTLIKYRFVD